MTKASSYHIGLGKLQASFKGFKEGRARFLEEGHRNTVASIDLPISSVFL